MSIGKKLYAGFGMVLAILVGLFLVNPFAALRGRASGADSEASLKGVQTIETVRLKIMLNRLNLDNFLLSGDPRDEEKVNKGISELNDTLKQGEAQFSADALRPALIQVESTEASWADNFAKPLLAKRHQVDSGDSTVSDLQIFYLQKDPTSWLAKSSAVLDQTSLDIPKALNESQAAASRAGAVSTIIVVVGALSAIAFGFITAFRTSKS